MNRHTLKGKWKQLRGEVRTKWGKLTDDDLDVVGGRYDKLVGRIQERYGVTKEKAREKVAAWKPGSV